MPGDERGYPREQAIKVPRAKQSPCSRDLCPESVRVYEADGLRVTTALWLVFFQASAKAGDRGGPRCRRSSITRDRMA